MVSGAKLHDEQYKIIKELGVGGQGFAYLANDLESGKEIVLKEFVLPVYVDINARKQALDRFEQEARLLTKLEHPQVVKLYGFFVEDHRAYLALEHIDGENLRQIVSRKGALNEDTVRSLAAQMIDILAYLHSLAPPLVHRDFTPDNLILNKDGTLKLIDFNVAQQVESTTTGTVVGKQAYLPPEQFRGQATAKSDIYAMGATLHFLLTGADPVPISTSSPLAGGAQVSGEIDDWIQQLTALDENERPSAEALKQILSFNEDITETTVESLHQRQR
jgi:serine/threonine-protein kinase